MRNPRAIYRVQFSPAFDFARGAEIVDYLNALGISDLYASPVFQARPGSPHGYDVVDPTQFNPELGGAEGFDRIVEMLQAYDMGWLQDIVPNHMAYSSHNTWLMDVLENGPYSDYAGHFDLAWNAPFEGNMEPILVPLLGNYYGDSLENGEITLQYGPNGLSAHYYELGVPLRLDSYPTFLTYQLEKLHTRLERTDPIYARILGILYLLRTIPDDLTGGQRRDYNDFVKGLLWDLYCDSEAVHEFIDENLRIFNGEPGKPESFNLLDTLLTEQYFRLAYWKVAAEEMNYRRFFTVNELISVRVEEPHVFEQTHDLIRKMVQAGKFTGLRIDHIDGLFDPTQYLQRLRARMGDVYLIVEKILEPGEHLVPMWDIQGTSGYDYLSHVNRLFCRRDTEAAFADLYSRLTGVDASFAEIAAAKKALIIEKSLAGDIDNLAQLLKQIAGAYRYGNDFTVTSLKRAIIEVLARFPIYRTYTNADGVMEGDRRYIVDVIQEAQANTTLLHNELEFIERLLLLDFDDTVSETDKERWLYWVMRVQQYTGPLMAKGVEDTALYVYNRLLSLNEVGCDPEHFGVDLDEFHAYNQTRQEYWHLAMSSTSTHDTKRGEDVRARLNVLSEIPDEWEAAVRRWRELNLRHKTRARNALYPDRNDEYMLYQTLVGAFPFDADELRAEGEDNFIHRIREYMRKALREAKVYTTWMNTNATYEDAVLDFVEAILAAPEGDADQTAFLQDFLPFQQRVAFYGIMNSLAQTLVKITSPGVPDFYQGTEYWDLNLVDPDNRRPVDFDRRYRELVQIKTQVQHDPQSLLQELLATKKDGRIKLFVMAQALQARAGYAKVFLEGDYVPLQVQGEHAEHVVAYARRLRDAQGETTFVVIVPRFLTGLVEAEEMPLGQAVWADTAVQMAPNMPAAWRNIFSDEALQATSELPVAHALQKFPVALLIGQG